MKRAIFFWVALWVLSIGITACDDDGGAGTISCDIPEADVCFTGSGSSSECTDAGGEVVDSCPGGAAKTCEVENDGDDVTMYTYGTAAEFLTCEQLADSFDLVVADDNSGSGNDNTNDNNDNNDNNGNDNNNTNSGGTISCDMSGYGVCMTGPNQGESCEEAGAVTVSACPGNAASECEVDVDGVTVTIFVYDGSPMAVLSCDDLQDVM